jgi:thiol:disulfide interchange protein
MQRIVGLMLTGLVFVSLAGCDQPAFEDGPAFHGLSYEEALDEAQKQNKVVVIDFGADWCGPCRQMEATTFKDVRVQQFLAQHTIAIKVDVDANSKLAGQLGVNSVPVVLFMDSSGYELKRLLGYKTADQFLAAAAAFKKG